MSKSYTTLNAIIVGKLKALLDGGGETLFVDVYNIPKTKPEGYPCAFVVDSAGEGAILDTARNEREWQFEISLIQEQGNKTPEEVAVIMRTIVDAVIDMFDQDPQLEVGGDQQCMRVRVVPLAFDYEIREQPFIFAKLLVACSDLVSNYP